MDLARSCKDSSELLAEIDHDLIEEMAPDDDDVLRSLLIKNNTAVAERNLEICSKEIRLLGRSSSSSWFQFEWV